MATNRVSDAQATYASATDALPDAAPEETAMRIDPSQVDGIVSSYKAFQRLAKDAQDADRRERCGQKAEYWRKVAEILWERKNGERGANG